MRWYDITQEVLSSKVYPGDPAPACKRIQELSKGDDCNLTYLSMCTHNGTHMDAPCHFIEGGRSIEEVGPSQFIGECLVLEIDGFLSGEAARRMLNQGTVKKLLLKGAVEISEDAACAFAEGKLELLGVESQTVGTEYNTQEVHKILLAADMVIVEGLVLTGLAPGEYFLCAMPLKLAGSDGAPCRVVLMQEDI